jgi:hypothetical protein
MFSTGGLPPGSSSANACPGFEFARLPPRAQIIAERDEILTKWRSAPRRAAITIWLGTIDAGCGRRASGRRWGGASAVMNLGMKILSRGGICLEAGALMRSIRNAVTAFAISAIG